MTGPSDSNKDVIIQDALGGILNAGTMLKNVSRQFFRNRPSTEVQFNVLLLLKHADHPMTQKELSERLLVDKSNLTGLVDRMETSGHIFRLKTPGDRRSYHLQLTEKAEKLLEELEGPYRELLHSMLGDFSRDELLLIVRMMNKLQRSLDNRCACSTGNLSDKEN